MKNQYRCEVECVDKEAVRSVKSKMLRDEVLFRVAESFQVLGDSTRIKLLHALSLRELCVCDLANLLSMSQSATSHQLQMLRESNLVKFRRQGKIIYYSLSDGHIINVLKMGVRHAKE